MSDFISRGMSKKNKDDISSLKMKVRVSVTDFGAKGDGITDDINAFNDCNTYCTTMNKVMFIPNGDYKLSQAFLPTCSMEGESRSGVKLNFYHASGERSIRVYKIGARPLKYAEPLSNAPVEMGEIKRALLLDQPAFLNYVTCATPSDANQFSVGDYVHIASGKDPFDADDSLSRYAMIWRIEEINTTTGKITLNGVIDEHLSDDGFNPTSKYYNPSNWANSTAYVIGDVVYQASSATNAPSGVYECWSAGTSNSSGTIADDTAVENPKWKRIAYALGSFSRLIKRKCKVRFSPRYSKD
jgi:hypothetical protein